MGGYDESYQCAEDWEMNHRIRQAGGLIWFQPRLRVTYRPRSTVGRLASQYFHYGRWRVTMHMSWGLGFLTSPRSLIPGVAGQRRDDG